MAKDADPKAARGAPAAKITPSRSLRAASPASQLFVFCDRAEHLEHHPARGGVGDQIYSEDAKARAPFFYLIYDVYEVAHRPGEPMELRTHEHVTLPKVVNCRLELLALGDAADLVGEYLFAARSF